MKNKEKYNLKNLVIKYRKSLNWNDTMIIFNRQSPFEPVDLLVIPYGGTAFEEYNRWLEFEYKPALWGTPELSSHCEEGGE